MLVDRSVVSRVFEHADEVEVELADGVNTQRFLKLLVEAGANISKFEAVEPSLNDIFIDQIGGER